MIGIYKITNKLNNKSYIGQSIHCGKRLDEHCRGAQLIDEIIQIEGIENFTFEILKEVNKEELSYWEDYYIMKYNTMFPNGYNKKWNCNREIRNQIEQKIKANTSQQTMNYKLNDMPQKIIENNLKIAIPIEEEYIVSNSMKLYIYLCLFQNLTNRIK